MVLISILDKTKQSTIQSRQPEAGFCTRLKNPKANWEFENNSNVNVYPKLKTPDITPAQVLNVLSNIPERHIQMLGDPPWNFKNGQYFRN